MSDSETHPWRENLGAYLVGALEADEAEGMRRHLDTCPQCRAEFAELEPVVGAMAQIPAEAFAGDEVPATAGFGVAPDEAMWERLRVRAGLAAADAPATARPVVANPVAANPVTVNSATMNPAAMNSASSGPAPESVSAPAAPVQAVSPSTKPSVSRPNWMRRPKRPALAAGISGVLVAAAAVGIYVGFHANSSSSAVDTVSAANAADGVSATIQYWPESWGSSVKITLHGVPPGASCTLYAVDAAGDMAVGGSWIAPKTHYTDATFSTAVSIQPSQIKRFMVQTNMGVVLLTVPAS